MDPAGLPPLPGLALTILIPGTVVTAAFFPPGELRFPGRVALAFAAGFVATSLSSWALIFFSVLNVWSFTLSLLLVTTLAGAVAYRRGSPSEHVAAIKGELRDDGATLLVGLAVLIGIGWAVSGSSTLFSLDSDTPMRFWGDGVEIADHGGIPDTTLQWGESWRPATSKMLFNSHTAATSLLYEEAVPATSASMWLVAVFLSAALWWLAYEIGLRWTSPLLPLITVANVTILSSEMAADVRPYRAEAFGRVIAISALALAVVALRDKKGWLHYLFAGLLFGVSAGTHLVPTVLCLAMLGGYLLCMTFVRSITKHHLVRLAAGLSLSALVLVLVWATPGGNLAFQGTTKTDAGVSGDVDQVELWVTGERSSLGEARRRTWYEEPSSLMSELVMSTTGRATDSPWLWLVAGSAVLIALVVFLAPTDLAPAASIATSLSAAIVAATLLFDWLYSSYAQALFGPRRLYDYSSITTKLVLLIGATVALRALEKRSSRASAVAPVALAALLAVVLLPDAHAVRPTPTVGPQLEELQWVRDNAECDARIISNRRTGGSYQVLTGRVNVNEGMGPFFRPDMLAHSNRLLLEMNEFFERPVAGRDFLDRWDIDLVVMARGAGGADSNLRSAPGYPSRMQKAGFLELVFTGERSNIYRVVGVEGTEGSPDPAEHPGYECMRGRIPT